MVTESATYSLSMEISKYWRISSHENGPGLSVRGTVECPALGWKTFEHHPACVLDPISSKPPHAKTISEHARNNYLPRRLASK